MHTKCLEDTGWAEPMYVLAVNFMPGANGM